MRHRNPLRKIAIGAASLLSASLALISPSCAGDLIDPPVIASAGGVIDILMIAQPGVVNGFSIPGFAPTGWFYTVCPRPASGTACPAGSGAISPYGGLRLALQQGDELKIRLVNNLPTVSPKSIERIHDDPLLALNPTNLHTHGLIVPAAANTTAPPALPVYGDFVFAEVFNFHGGDPRFNPALYNKDAYSEAHEHNDIVYNSQSAADYDIHIPANHPSGSFWFHAHIHGDSGNQLSAGLSGIISIGNVAAYACRDENCNNPILESDVRHLIMKDMQVLAGDTPLFQEDPTFCGNPESPASAALVPDGACPGVPAAARDYTGGNWFFTLNGQQFPNIPIASPQGEIWRFTNASASATYHLQIVYNDKNNLPTDQPMPFQIIAIDGVAVSFPAGSTAGQIKIVGGNRFTLADCGSMHTTFASQPVCATELFMTPATRVEIVTTYRDPHGNLIPAPPGASATLRNRGITTSNPGGGGDPWPEVNLASVTFPSGAINPDAEPVHVSASAVMALRGPSGIFTAARPDIRPRTAPAACQALAPGHRRRVYFANPNIADGASGPGTDRFGNAIFGTGYEEIDQFGQIVPGTFVNVQRFDPANIICLPLGPGQTPVIETWEVVNLATELHNFHMHQTKFTATTASAGGAGAVIHEEQQVGIQEDTVPLPFAVAGPGSQPMLFPGSTSCLVSDVREGKCAVTPILVQIPFSQLGTFVFHCHILEHEDGGMMHAIRVVAAPS